MPIYDDLMPGDFIFTRCEEVLSVEPVMAQDVEGAWHHTGNITLKTRYLGTSVYTERVVQRTATVHADGTARGCAS